MACRLDGSRSHSTEQHMGAMGGGNQGYGNQGFGGMPEHSTFGGGGNFFTGKKPKFHVFSRFNAPQQQYMQQLLGYLGQNIRPTQGNLGIANLPEMGPAPKLPGTPNLPNLPNIYQSQNFLQNPYEENEAFRQQLRKQYMGEVFPEAMTNLQSIQGPTGRSSALDAANYGLRNDLAQKLRAFDVESRNRQMDRFTNLQQLQEQANAQRYGALAGSLLNLGGLANQRFATQQQGALGLGNLGVERYKESISPLLERAKLRLSREQGRNRYNLGLGELALGEPWTMGQQPGSRGLLGPLIQGGASLLGAALF